ncbi:hypothetical protein, partial [Salmonella enterica]|uniref:hypothetical protein n=1 Tax=Salmonella enterica TaxID=28901 RepID=UPI0020C4EDF1
EMDRKIDNLLKAIANSDKKVSAISTPEPSGIEIKDPSKLTKHVQFVNTIALVEPNETNDEEDYTLVDDEIPEEVDEVDID